VALWKVRIDSDVRWAVGDIEAGPGRLLTQGFSIDSLLASQDFTKAMIESQLTDESLSEYELLAPLESQEIWAAGVTYLRSREARRAESGLDVYDAIYESDRPELFLKSVAWRVSGPGAPVGIRAESSWDVPEPELGVVADCAGRVVAFTIGNDMSSRSIEGENPLYLPQAKYYDRSCAIGPALVPVWEAPDPLAMEIRLEVVRDEHCQYEDVVRVDDMARTIDELVGWLYLGLTFPIGTVLLTGTAIVPPLEFTLRPGDLVRIDISGLGRLQNPVTLSGRAIPSITAAGQHDSDAGADRVVA
jgi:2-dehydro-3-deoxy-D-arabinonate dehydratase